MNEILILKILLNIFVVAFIIMAILACFFKEEAIQAKIDMNKISKTERLKDACKKAYLAAVIDSIEARMDNKSHSIYESFNTWWDSYKH